MRLSHRDFDALQGAILELHAFRDLEDLWQAVPRVFLEVIAADDLLLSGFNIDLAAKRTTMVEIRASFPRLTQEMIQTMERFALVHPFAAHFLRTGDPTALKLSDFFSAAQFRNSPMCQECYRPLAIKRLLSVGVTSRLSNAAAISMPRKGRDFTERDRLMMNLLQPHLDLACRNAESATGQRTCGARPMSDYALSPRETEAARWVGEGKTNPEIAIILGASVRTIEKHVGKIIEKLGVENRTSAALMVAKSAWKA